MKQAFIKTDIKTFTIDLEDDQVYTIKNIIEMGLQKYVQAKYSSDFINDGIKNLVRARIGTSYYKYDDDDAVEYFMTSNYLDHQTINLYFSQRC